MIDVAIALIGIGFTLAALVMRMSNASELIKSSLIILFISSAIISFMISAVYILNNSSFSVVGEQIYFITLMSFIVFTSFIVLNLIISIIKWGISVTKRK